MHSPRLRFRELRITNVSSDHLSYHLKSLVQLKLVSKQDNFYTLTPEGKEYANRMDTEQMRIEKQPKIAVMVVVEKHNKGGRQLLIQTRTKEPFFGFKGFITGKVRFGEKMEEAAKRELKEETGLKANLTLKYILHEHVKDRTDKLLEDKIFHVFVGVNPKGKLISTKDGSNNWMSETDFRNAQNAFYDEVDILNWIKKPVHFFIEKDYVVDSF